MTMVLIPLVCLQNHYSYPKCLPCTKVCQHAPQTFLCFDDCSLVLPFRTIREIISIITSFWTLLCLFGVVNSSCTKFPQIIPVQTCHLLPLGPCLIERTLKGGRSILKELTGETRHIFCNQLLIIFTLSVSVKGVKWSLMAIGIPAWKKEFQITNPF